jgi:anti-sigma-K factor RskA
MNDVHEHISSLIAAYAIGAVPEDEVPQIRAHILTCEACFAEAEGFAEALALMPETVGETPLSANFEDKVIAAVRPEGSPAKTRVVRRPRFRLSLAAGLASLLVIALAGTTIWFGSSWAKQRNYQNVVAALVHDRDALQLSGPGGAEAILASTSDGSVLVTVDLGEAPEGRDYQLWLMDDGVPTPANTFDVDGSVIVIETDFDLRGFEGAAITVEPEGGSTAPTTEPVLTSS